MCSQSGVQRPVLQNPHTGIRQQSSSGNIRQPGVVQQPRAIAPSETSSSTSSQYPVNPYSNDSSKQSWSTEQRPIPQALPYRPPQPGGTQSQPGRPVVGREAAIFPNVEWFLEQNNFIYQILYNYFLFISDRPSKDFKQLLIGLIEFLMQLNKSLQSKINNE